MTERENVLRVFRGELPEWLPESGACFCLPGKILMDIERPHFQSGTDWFGCQWLEQHQLGGVVTHPDTRAPHVLRDITRWREEIAFPDLEAYDFDALGRDLRADLPANGDKLTQMMLEHGPFERLTLLMGFEEALMALVTEPEACADYAEAMADFKIRLLDKVFKEHRFDFVLCQDDLGSEQGPLMSPAVWRAVFKEPQRRIGAHVKSLGAIFGYHSCGCMEAFAEELLDIGVELINPVQTCNDQVRMKRLCAGRAVLFGGLDNTHVTAISHPTEEMLREEIQRCVRVLAPGGGFIIQIRPDNFAENGVDVRGILNEEYEKLKFSFYQEPENRLLPEG